MHVFATERGFGKTTELIKLAAEHGGYIVCRDRRMAGEIADMARKRELHIAFPITYDEFLNKRYYGQNISRFYIDDADALLQSMSSVRIDAITVTVNEDEVALTSKPEVRS